MSIVYSTSLHAIHMYILYVHVHAQILYTPRMHMHVHARTQYELQPFHRMGAPGTSDTYSHSLPGVLDFGHEDA